MGERKVLNKYFPPDFDPKKVPRLKRDPLKQICVRMMIPFSMQCNTCGEFMYRGKKFNSLKEDCIGEDYLGIKRFRFYIKCITCSQEITFKTDPENGDYELETGASRNFEAWADKKATEEKHKKAREEEEKSDNMKALENRTLDSKIEMEIMDALDEIKAVNRRHETVDTAKVLEAAAARREREGGSGGPVSSTVSKSEEAEENAMIASIQFGGPRVRRLSDDEDYGNGGTADDADTAGSSGKRPDGSRERPSKHSKRRKLAENPSSPHKKITTSSRDTGKKVAGGGSDGGDGLVGARAKDDGDRRDSPTEVGVGGRQSTAASSCGDGAPGTSSLLSGIEAQARREAEKAKSAATQSSVTIIVRKKKRREKDGKSGTWEDDPDGDVGRARDAKQKKGKRPIQKKGEGGESRNAGKPSTGDQAKGKAAAAVSVSTPLGGLLGAYGSSGSDEDER